MIDDKGAAGMLPSSVDAINFSQDAAGHLSGVYLRYTSYGEPDATAQYIFFFYVIRTSMGVVLFDSGFDEQGKYPRQNTPVPVDVGLRALGIDADDVTMIVLSHTHYDHSGNLQLFNKARIVLQRAEWDFVQSPMGRHGLCGGGGLVNDSYVAELERAERQGRLRLLDGDTKIAPGLEAITLAGHSPGSQGLVITIADGSRVALAGDAGSFYDAWRLDRPLSILTSLPQMYEAFARLRALEADGVTVVPAHDPQVLEIFAETVLDEGGSIVRLAPRN